MRRRGSDDPRGLLVPVHALMGRFTAREHLEALDAEEAPGDVEDEFVGP